MRPVKGRSLWADGIRRLRKRSFAMICLVIVLVYFVLAGTIYLNEMFNWNLQAFDWDEIVGPSYQAPMTEFTWTPEGQGESQTGWTLFGTDFLGRSTLRKTIYGAKTSITVALCASFISLLIGVPLGAIAGYFRGWVDDIIQYIYTTEPSRISCWSWRLQWFCGKMRSAGKSGGLQRCTWPSV